MYNPRDATSAYANDVTIEMFDGVLGLSGALLFCQDDDARPGKRAAFIEGLKQFVSFHQDRMVAHKWDHIAGDKVQVADFIVGSSYYTFKHESLGLGEVTEIFN